MWQMLQSPHLSAWIKFPDCCAEVENQVQSNCLSELRRQRWQEREAQGSQNSQCKYWRVESIAERERAPVIHRWHPASLQHVRKLSEAGEVLPRRSNIQRSQEAGKRLCSQQPEQKTLCLMVHMVEYSEEHCLSSG